MDDREQRIRDRAYEIWLGEGQPEGRAVEHWSRAALELGYGDAPPSGSKAIPRPSDESTEKTGGVSPGQVLSPD